MLYKLFLSILINLVPLWALAQTAADIDFITSWRARSYVEPTYLGRVLPTYGTPVEVSFEMLENNKPVNLSNQIINWVVDNAPFRSGPGLQNITFPADPLQAGSEHVVKIAVTDYKGSDRTRLVRIPIRRPEAVIKTPFTRGEAGPGTYELKTRLFYWNITNPNDLAYIWSSNGEGAGDAAGPNIILTISPQAQPYPLRLSLNIRSRANDLETATINLSLVVK